MPATLLLVQLFLFGTISAQSCETDCTPCKVFSNGAYAGTWNIKATTDGRCPGSCLYQRSNDSREMCFCDPGTIQYQVCWGYSQEWIDGRCFNNTNPTLYANIPFNIHTTVAVSHFLSHVTRLDGRDENQPDGTYERPKNSVANCRSYCKNYAPARPYTYFGLSSRKYIKDGDRLYEDGDLCFCGNTEPPTETHNEVDAKTYCNLPCRANNTEMCGGYDLTTNTPFINVYQIVNTTTTD